MKSFILECKIEPAFLWKPVLDRLAPHLAANEFWDLHFPAKCRSQKSKRPPDAGSTLWPLLRGLFGSASEPEE